MGLVEKFKLEVFELSKFELGRFDGNDIYQIISFTVFVLKNEKIVCISYLIRGLLFLNLPPNI